MTRIFVPRGSSSSTSSSNQNRPNPSSSLSRDEEQEKDSNFTDNSPQIEPTDQPSDEKQPKSDDLSSETDPQSNSNSPNPSQSTLSLSQISLTDKPITSPQSLTGSPQLIGSGSSHPPPPPVPPPKPSSQSNLRRLGSGGPTNNTVARVGSSRRWGPQQPSSPRSETDGYNSADEQGPCLKPSNYADAERERMFEVELRRVKGYEIRRMMQDGNCLFRAVADQVYGDPEAYDMARQMAVDYMERERDHFSQFITEGFTSYCKRKRRDKVYGNNVEIQAFAEMYNRPIHIYSYSTEPINIFQGSYNTDTPPIRLSYHHGNHYNSLVDPRRLTVGAGLGFSSLRGVNNADRDQVKAAIKAQQDQQIDNALIAEGRFYSDMELTEKEIERMVMEASRAEYLKQQQQHSFVNSAGAEPSSSATIIGPSRAPSTEREDNTNNNNNSNNININNNGNNNGNSNKLTGSMQVLMAMGFSYMQVIEAYSIFGDDVDSMICYLVEMGATSADSSYHRRKGKAAE